MNITLKDVNAENLRKISVLKVKPEQQSFIAPNAISVAQSKFYPTWVCLAAYAGVEPVGFSMYGIDDNDKSVWIIRMMIDENHQGRGYGREILTLTTEHIKNNIICKEIFLSFDPENFIAKKLYESFGFLDTGRIEVDEIVYKLEIS